MAYTTQNLVQGYIGRDLTPQEAKIIKMVIDAVGKWIDKITGSSWEPVVEARVFNGGEHDIFIDPIIDITKIEYLNTDGSVNTTYVNDGTDWVAYPLNKKTKTSITRLGGHWPRGSGNIRVTGKWGEVGGVPADLQLAATILVADWLSNEDKLKSESIEGYSRTFADTQDSNPQVDKILSSYRRILI